MNQPYAIELRFDAVNDRAASELNDAIRRLHRGNPDVTMEFHQMRGYGNAGENWLAQYRVRARRTRRATAA